ASDDDAGGNLNFSLTFTAAATQTYYLKIRPYSALATWSGMLYYRSIPPAFTARLSVSPRTSVIGQVVTVVITVTNTGGMATGVLPAIQVWQGAAALVPVSGPLPAGPVSIPYLAQQSFTWT